MPFDVRDKNQFITINTEQVEENSSSMVGSAPRVMRSRTLPTDSRTLQEIRPPPGNS